MSESDTSAAANSAGVSTNQRPPLVLVAPSYGNPASRARFRDTLDQAIDFTGPPVAGALTRDERAALLATHPDGAARFWGATDVHNRTIERVRPGDHILFTGKNRVQAIGRIGCKLRNPALADVLWTPEAERGSWSNVYTVVNFGRVADLRYDEIWVLTGYKRGYVFQGTVLLSPERSAALIAGLGLDAADVEVNDDHAEETLLADLDAGSRIFAAETARTDETRYERTAGTITVRRAEHRLVARYRETLPEAAASRLSLAVGWTDLYLEDEADLIEAKRSADHRFVREALGQLLDYAAHSSHPVERLTALFPESPSPRDVRLLHRYGIDCLHWEKGDTFVRFEAPLHARERMRELWSQP